jgi:hypothetical protein
MKLRETCPDCGVGIGELHQRGCDIETCPKCGGQALSCDCECEFPDDQRIGWIGCTPSHQAADRYNFYCYWDPAGRGDPAQHYGWKRVPKTDPRADLDLNRVFDECRWDRNRKQFIKMTP